MLIRLTSCEVQDVEVITVDFGKILVVLPDPFDDLAKLQYCYTHTILELNSKR